MNLQSRTDKDGLIAHEKASCFKAYPYSGGDRPVSMIRIRAAAGNSRKGWLTAPRFDHSGGARPRRHPGQQARGRRRHAARHFPSATAVVARRPLSAAAHLSRHARDHARRRLVRRPERPALQPADPRRARPQGRPADAHGSSLRFHRRDRSQHAPARRRPRQRGVLASGARQFRPDRGLRLHDEVGDAAPVAAARTANQNCDR